MSSLELTFTIFTSKQPPRLTKVLGLNSDGTLRKTAAASMVNGIAERHRVPGLTALAKVLEALTPSQAVAWGVSEHERVPIVPQDGAPEDGTTIARDRKHFAFPKGPGVMMLDHDGGNAEALTAEQVRERLLAACPALADVPMLWRPSVSAGVRAPDGRALSGLTRHRFYIPVIDASMIPEAGRRLVALLWAAGHGWVEVGTAGQALVRTLVDASVWQPERLDFAAPPVLLDGLTRLDVTPIVYGDAEALFDLSLVEADASTVKKANVAQQAARKEARPACATARERWAAERASALAKERSITEPKANALLIRASEYATLMGDFMLTAQGGRRVSVAQMLDDPDRWHNQRFADPLGSYPEDDRIAVANLLGGGRPTLYSHGHGGMRFELMRQAERVQVGRGLRVQATDAALSSLRARGDLFDFGEGAVAYVSGGKARPVSVDWLADHMGRVCDFYSVRNSDDEYGNRATKETPEDAPAGVARAILAKHGDRAFRRLLAVVSAPTLRMDGSILDRPGYDEASALLYVTDEAHPPRIPERPSVDDALEALADLWVPFAEFPLIDDVSRGVVLQGILSAALRGSLPTTPGIGLDAPSAGTGKTLLARCIGILAAGVDPSILPPADSDEETRKRLFAALREGARTLVWDNVREPLGCAALDSFLTAQMFADRILGLSETASLPNRSLFITTGNNLRLTGDTCRRIFVARLDAQIERPYARDFAFDPAQRVMVGRQRYVVAALTIVRAFIAAGRPKVAEGRTASFEAWDDLVRQPLCWLADIVRSQTRDGLPTFDDPLKAADLAFEADPETSKLAAVLTAWRGAFGPQQTTVAQAISRADFGDEDLRAAFDEVAGQAGRINPRILGRWIERQVGRRLGGLWFDRIGLRKGYVHWAVNATTGSADQIPPEATKPTKASAALVQTSVAPLVGLVADGGISAGNGRACVNPARARRPVIWSKPSNDSGQRT